MKALFQNPFIIILFSLWLKWLVSLQNYSGRATPPLYGDFEAQRHWLEITLHVPRELWYKTSEDYWRLDYPPLTAFHSLLLGYIANWIHPPWVALETSRGFESLGLKTFMRLTVILSELFIYVPAIYLISKKLQRSSKNHSFSSFCVLLFMPCLLIIDHGHFQYNSVMLGLSAWAIACFLHQKFLLGAVFFCLSLLFKQMALFYALPIFFYLLGQCKRKGWSLFLGLAFCTAFTFGFCFLAVSFDLQNVLQILVRIFPVHRGLWEDKVANFWCASNIFIKLRSLFDLQTLIRTSFAATLLAVLPSSIHAFLYPSKKTLIYALVNSSLGFFLFSFQVHEKSILLPAFAITLLYQEDPLAVIWFNNVAVFSMLPLLIRDEVAFAAVLLMILWTLISRTQTVAKSALWMKRSEIVSYGFMILIYVCDFIFGSPPRFPHLYTVLNVEMSAGLFMMFLIYFNYKQFKLDTKQKSE